ncbi:MAG: TIGR03435 family protein [Candidatus Solibacter sp.]|jgi:uncharacterized protein (TIGR03435 family)
MRLAVALWFACRCISAQPGEVGPTFEVASVKRLPADAPRHGLVREISPTSLTLRYATLGNCIQWAYGYQNFQVAGPNWRDHPTDVIYDIVAKSASPVPESQLKLMLQTLLKERLGLAVHREPRELPVYAMVVARNGPKFRPSEAKGEPSMKPAGRYTTRFERVTMAQFAKIMDPPFTSHHVVDETGLAGTFDFTLNLSPYVLDPQTGEPVVDNIGRIDDEGAYLRALPAQLGLRLERKTAPLEVLVIDHVEKDPTAN